MKLAKYARVNLPEWIYLGGQVIVPNGAAAAATLPTTATIIEMRPEGGAMYFNINHVAANANVPGYIADGGGEILGPLGNLNLLSIYAAAGVTVHVMYFREG